MLGVTLLEENINTVRFDVWSESDRPESISKAEVIMSYLEGMKDDILRPNTTCYNILMNAYANQTVEYGFTQRAEDVLLKMSKMSKN